MRFNSSDTSQPAPTTVRRATIPMVQDLGGVSLGTLSYLPFVYTILTYIAHRI